MKILEINSRGAVILLLMVAVAIILFKPLVSIPYIIPKDYNEGYHALLSLRAYSDEMLYPGMGSLVTNGYTPLSFYIVGGAAALFGDVIITGRVIALISFILVSLAIGFIVYHINRSLHVAWFASAVFAGFVGVYHSNYIGMNDPQWLAQAIMMSGFCLLLFRYKHAVWIPVVVVIMLAAGMTKHILIPLPLAITIWLYLQDRQKFYIWISSGTVFLILALGATYYFYGMNFFANLLELQPEYSYVTVLYRIKTWLANLSPFLGALLIYMLIEPPGRYKQLLIIYVIVSSIWGFLLSGGRGIDMNHIYDLIIALVIISGLVIHRLGEQLQKIWARSAVESAAMIILSMTVLIAVPSKVIEARWAFSDLDLREGRVADTVERISDQDGPVLCETLALCYWAGKAFDADILVLSRKIKSGTITAEQFRNIVDSHYFRIIQLHDGGTTGTTRRLTKDSNDYILERYDVSPNSMGGSFLTPANKGDGLS